eukprot:TRINITY_DN4948_c0_g1_i2.p2 TRINITY_DN4948_c0_g1~~TRINITY_DN4948_c0_g1_i2.p2  ORF type:complete len:267 (+),score=38.58 TRINITY_DN4948_c0_g1_i2:1011-1811(+)
MSSDEEEELTEEQRLSMQHYFQLVQQYLFGNVSIEVDDEIPEELIQVKDVKDKDGDLCKHEIATDIMNATGCRLKKKKDDRLLTMLWKREHGIGAHSSNVFSRRQQTHLAQRFIPGGKAAREAAKNFDPKHRPVQRRRRTYDEFEEDSEDSEDSADDMEWTSSSQEKKKVNLGKYDRLLDSHENQLFCGQFSSDGRTFMSACQDRTIRLYDTVTWETTKEISAKDVGWSIIDTDYSPDQRFLIYSSWSDYISVSYTHLTLPTNREV